MAIRAILSICVMLSLIAADSNAGPETLDSLIRTALEKNKELISADNYYQSMKYSADAAGALPDPQFSLSALNLPRKSLSLTGMPMTGISIGVSQSIPWPSRLSSASSAAKYSAQSDSANALGVRNRVIRMVAHSYYEYSYWVFAIQLLDENISLSQDIIDFVETRYSNGESSIEEVISARVNKSKMENMRLNFESKKQSAIFAIRQLVDDSTLTEESIPPFLTFKMSESIEQIPDYTGSPALIGALSKFQAARSRHSLARSEYWPNLTIGANYLIRKEDSSLMSSGPVGPGEDLLSFHLGFTLPLWFFSKQKKKTSSTRYAVESARAEQDYIDITLRQSIQTTITELRSLRGRINQFIGSIIPMNEAAYEAAFVAYEVDQIDFKSLLADQIELYNSKIDHIALVKEYHQTRAYLDELIGKGYGEY